MYDQKAKAQQQKAYAVEDKEMKLQDTQPGTSVAFYTYDGRCTGVISQSPDGLGIMLVKTDGGVWRVHYKQCRKLNKRTLRTLWVGLDDKNEPFVVAKDPLPGTQMKWVKVKECRTTIRTHK